MTEIKKALTFRASSIGDCLMGKYLLDNVHAQFPNARCGIVVGSRGAMIRDLLADYPWIEVIEANRRSPRALWRLWWRWRGSDIVVTQYAGKPSGTFSLSSKLVGRLLGKTLIGFKDASAFGFLYDTLLPFDPMEAPAECERRALAAAGIRVSIPYPTLHATAPAASTRQIVVHLFSGSAKRGLSAERKHALVQALERQLPTDVQILLTGTPGERAQALEAAKGTRASVHTDMTLQETMALIAASERVVALDTGVAHIAAQLGKPLIVFTSCLGAQWWTLKQYGAPETVRVCTNRAACGGHHAMVDYPPCLNAISYDDTFLHV